MQQRVSGDGIGMHERWPHVRVVQHRVLSERYRVCGVHVHVQQRVSGDGIGMHEQRRQVCVMQQRVLQGRERLQSVLVGTSPRLYHFHRLLVQGM